MIQRIRLLDELGAQFARVAAEAERASREPSAPVARRSRSAPRARAFAVALGVAVLLGAGAYAVPGTRAAVDSVADSFAGWVSGDSDQAPGRPLELGDKVPTWFDEVGEARLIAETEGVGLFVRRVDSDEGPRLEFGLGEGPGVIMGGTLESWRHRFDQHAVFVLGYTLFGPQDVLDEQGRAPLLGVAARDVERVELRYSEGPSLVGATGDGGFVLLVDAWRPLGELIAYDAAGRVLERTDVSGFDMRYLCEKEPACPREAG